MNRPPERELVARMRESRRRSPALLVHEAEPFEGLGARPDALVAHEREVRAREPGAVGGGEWDHDFARGADFYWALGWALGKSPLWKEGKTGLRIGPGLRRAVSFIKLSR